MEGIICDLHVHVVPAFDDGADDLQTALGMLKLEYEQGVRRVFCTSHSWKNKAQRASYDAAFEKLRLEAGKTFPDLELLPGCEAYCESANVREVIRQLKEGVLPTLNGSKYVLTELFYDVMRKEAFAVAGALLEQGFVPVLAHAERYWLLSAENAAELVDRGCLVQINAYSLSEAADATTRNIAEELCRRSLVHFIGSDAHGTARRPPRLEAGLTRLRQICGEESFDRITRLNALKIEPETRKDLS